MIDIFDDKFQKDNFFREIDDIEKLGIIEEEERKNKKNKKFADEKGDIKSKID